MNYTESGPHGTIGEESQRLVAVARGDEDPDTIVENGTLVNVHTGELQAGMALVVAAGRIARVVPTDEAADLAGAETTVIDAEGRYMAPGFLDTHEHIESSMVTVTGFAKGVLPRGTTGVFMDPHEIGNVLGLEGIRWMLDEAEHVPLKVWCAVSSCVPAAPGFEDAGAVIDSDDVAEAMDWPEVVGLGEMMDFPGVIRGDEEVHEKLAATYEAGQVATGHFSLLSTDEQLDAFIASGISSCHESVTREGALERLRRGLWTMLRQGSAWKDVPETIKAVTERSIDTRHLLLVTDDIHPGTIVDTGHLDEVVRVAIENGLDPISAIQAVTINAAEYFGVDADVGSLSPGKCADVLFIDDLAGVAVEDVMLNGEMLVEGGEWNEAATQVQGFPTDAAAHTDLIHDAYPQQALDTVALTPPGPEQFAIEAPEGAGDTVTAQVMAVIENQVGTNWETVELPVEGGEVAVPESEDVSKTFVFERHADDGSVGHGFVSGFGFERGAVASTVAHDSHNMLVVGRDEASMARAAERLCEIGGGMIAVDDGEVLSEVGLPVAGLMADRPLADVAGQVGELHEAWQDLGCDLDSPFMTMSLLALPVLPELRLTNRGLIDTVGFEFVDPVSA